jgi:transposase
MAENRQFADIITGNRQKNHQFNDESRAAMIALRISGRSYGKIATEFNTTKSTVFNIYKRYTDENKTTPRPRPGPKSKFSESNRRYLDLQVKRNRSITIHELRKQADECGVSATTKTISRVMRATWGHKWRRKKRILLTKALAKQRLRFVLEWAPKVEELKKVWTPKGVAHIY